MLSPKPGPPAPVGSWRNQAFCGWDCVCGPIQTSRALGCEGRWGWSLCDHAMDQVYGLKERSAHPLLISQVLLASRSKHTPAESTTDPLSAGFPVPGWGGYTQAFWEGGPFAPGPRAPGPGRKGRRAPVTSRSGETSSKAPFSQVSPDTLSPGCGVLARTVTAGILSPDGSHPASEDRAESCSPR